MKPADRIPHDEYLAQRTPFARYIDDRAKELSDLSSAVHSFTYHLQSLEAFLRVLAPRPPSAAFAGDVCHSCGIDGVKVRQAMRDLRSREQTQ